MSRLFPFLTVVFSILILQACSSSKEAAVSVVEEAPEVRAVEEGAQPEDEEEENLLSPFSPEEYNPSATRIHDLLHTRLEVRFDWDKAYLYGKAHLSLTPYYFPASELVLDAKGFDLHEVSLVKGEEKMPLDYRYDSLQIFINLDREYSRKDTFNLFIDYTARPNEREEGGSSAIMSDKGLYFINPDGSQENKPQQIWTQGETEASSGWFPTIDKPNERTTQEIYITVDDRFVTLSNGVLMTSTQHDNGTRTDYWKMDKPHAPYLFMMAVGEFAVAKDMWEDLEVNYYVDPEYEPYAYDIFGNTPEMLTFYSDVLGVRYPWPKYSQVVVEDFVSGAMENTTATIHFGGLHKTDRELLDSDHEDIIAHELFHHWFGDLVTCESWANIPLNEAFATYGEYLWIEHKYGRDEADWHLLQDLRQYMQEANGKRVDLIRYRYDDKEEMFDGHSYQKGGRVLHMLRKYLGDEAFFDGLNYYLEQNKYRAAEIHDLRLAMEEVSGEDLNWFFEQWFLSAGHPELEINYEYDETAGVATVMIEQKQETDNTPVYLLPIDIDIYVDDEVQRHRILLDRQKQAFHFDLAKEPQLINVDAEKMLLAEIDDNKSTDAYIYQLTNAPLFLDRYNAVVYLTDKQYTDEKARLALYKALEDPSFAVRRKAIVGLDINSETEALIGDKLIQIAMSDPESAVRAPALEKVQEMVDVDHLPLYEKALKDSSYRVISTAMELIAEIDPDKGFELAKQNEASDNTDIMLTVMDIYADQGGVSENDYFLGKLNDSEGFTTYFVMNLYGNYLKRMEDDEVIEKGTLALKDIALNNNAWWISATALNKLMAIKDANSQRLEELKNGAGDADDEIAALDQRIDMLESVIEELSNNQ